MDKRVQNSISFLKSYMIGLKPNQSKRFSMPRKKHNAAYEYFNIFKKQEEKEPAQLIVRFSTKVGQGLSTGQVEQRYAQNLVNNTKIKTSKSYFSIFYKNIFTFFNMIWLIIAIALCCAHAFKELLFVFVIIANTAIAIIQEIRAKVTVEKLSLQTLPHVIAIRNGQEVEINSSNIVLDDLIKLSNGNQVPADCIVVDGKVEVNESLLTGESNSIVKKKGDRLLSGSYLVSGQCYAQVDKIGKDNYMYQIASRAREFKAPQSNMFKDINRLIKYIGIALIPIGALTFWKEYIQQAEWQNAVKYTSGMLTAMIPAGMFLLITISLAVGVVKLARKKTLVRDPYSIEMLSRTNVLCLDKTGTITDGTMNVVDYKNYAKQRKNGVKEILAQILYNQKSTNSTSNALIKKFGKQEKMALNIVEFSSERKFSVTELEKNKIYFLGAATFIKCKLSAEQKAYISDAQSKGLRIVVLTELDSQFTENITGENSKVLAIILLEEHIREDAIETIRWFRENGVQIKIISGDDPATVSKIATKVGIENSEKYVSLEDFSPEEVEQMADQFTVFGRVTPEQKYTLIKALKKKGNVVSMTGDGVNDSLALKEADCSIAMADGSEVARNISNVVLLNSTFSSLPAIVKEGRQVVNSVQNSSALYLMKTFFAILLSITTLIFGLSYPFTPIMMFLIEFFVIGIPSYILAFEPNTNQIKGNFIPQAMKRAIPRALLMFINILMLVILYNRGSTGFTVGEYSTLCVLVLTYTGFINLCSLCIPLTLIKSMAMGVSLLGLVIANCAMPYLFYMTDFTPAVMVAFAVMIAVSLLLTVLVKLNKKGITKLKHKLIRLLQKTDE